MIPVRVHVGESSMNDALSLRQIIVCVLGGGIVKGTCRHNHIIIQVVGIILFT